MLISKIEIINFRSVYSAKLSNLNDITVLSGKNDTGKSNILKALNLFFNGYIDKPGDFNFSENYSLQRYEEAKKGKHKQYIQIKVTFNRGKRYETTLPDSFTVSKKWNRDSTLPIINDNIEYQFKKKRKKYSANTKSSLTRFLNKIEYIYIPAIKDKELFNGMIEMLQTNIYSHKLDKNEHLNKSLQSLYTNVVSATKDLSDEFKSVTDIESMIAPPTEVDELYKSLHITTAYRNSKVALENRGDGIRVRYIPSILNYIAENSNSMYIWGFEEPENSLEYNLAKTMSEDFYNKYSKRSMIILTSHSPAFIDLGNAERGAGFRCFKDEEQKTNVLDYESAKDLPSLAEELGYCKILQEQYSELKRIQNENAQIKEHAAVLEEKIQKSKKPILFTEGKTDVKILKVAWEKLYNKACPFDILSCNLLDENDDSSLAGAGVLRTELLSCRFDSSKIIIGLFDNDHAGITDFKLDSNYSEIPGKDWKRHITGKGYAFLIPANTEELKKIKKLQNLSIEFLFSKDSISRKVKGTKLGLIPMTRKVTINGIPMEETATEEWYSCKIEDSTKNYFASYIVPTFTKDEFANFIDLFDIVIDILNDAKKNGNL